ncbi:hypothetical protein KAU15_05495, partial [candidate division WOR-3 bacterium]|nr:hypothetical protein [candidate division WOR-3 bacterium]
FFRGSRLYRITWHEETINDSTTLTCEVWDMQNNLEIPFDTLDIGDCWHFSIYSSSVMDNVEYLNENSSNTAKTGMYFSFINVYFNYPGRVFPMNWNDRPIDGEIWDITIADTSDYPMPPVGAKFICDLTKYQFNDYSDTLLEKIKVVPNPYVVRSEFGQDYAYRKMYFTNLPNECIINIYTLAGDLIKKIEHNTAFYQYDDVGDSTLVHDKTQGSVSWNILTDNNQIPAPGLYLYKVMTPSGASIIGKFAIIK